MQTHLLSNDEVGFFLADLVARLRSLEEGVPTTWYYVGPSGEKIAEQLLNLLSEDEQKGLTIHAVHYERKKRGVDVLPGEGMTEFPKRALLLDGPIHSGRTMLAVARWLASNGVYDVISYGLMIKRTSVFIPSYFGLMVGEHDRAYFQMDVIPNHRLKKVPPFGIMRLISEEDLEMQPQYIDCKNSLSEISLSDLWYQKVSRGDNVYLYEVAGEVVAFIHFTTEKDQTILIDGVAVAEAFQSREVGGMLLRWVENWARNRKLFAVELFAIVDRIKMYEHLGFEGTGDKPVKLGSESYVKMRRKLLYNITPPSPLLAYS